MSPFSSAICAPMPGNCRSSSLEKLFYRCRFNFHSRLIAGEATIGRRNIDFYSHRNGSLFRSLNSSSVLTNTISYLNAAAQRSGSYWETPWLPVRRAKRCARTRRNLMKG